MSRLSKEIKLLAEMPVEKFVPMEPTLAHILNTLAECGLRVDIWPPCYNVKGYDAVIETTDANATMVVDVVSRISAEDALRRAWSRRKVQKIVKERTK